MNKKTLRRVLYWEEVVKPRSVDWKAGLSVAFFIDEVRDFVAVILNAIIGMTIAFSVGVVVSIILWTEKLRNLFVRKSIQKRRINYESNVGV